ncbi:hypothetical protein RF637_12920 [Kocuria sp. CPCC 204721]
MATMAAVTAVTEQVHHQHGGHEHIRQGIGHVQPVSGEQINHDGKDHHQDAETNRGARAGTATGG